MIFDFEMVCMVMSVTITRLGFFYNAKYRYYYLQKQYSVVFILVLSIQFAIALLVKYLAISNSVFYLLPFNVLYIAVFYHILIKSTETKQTKTVFVNSVLIIITISYFLVLKYPTFITLYYLAYHILLLIILLQSIVVYTTLMTKEDAVNLTSKWYFTSMIIFGVLLKTWFIYNLILGFDIEKLRITNVLFLIFISLTLSVFIVRVVIFRKEMKFDESEVKKLQIINEFDFIQKVEKDKYQKSRLNDEEFSEIKKKLQKITEEQLYLDSELNLDSLSRKLRVPKYALSQTFSVICSTNFKDYINYLRCEFSLQFILEEKLSKSILEIGYLSGFNSKTSFYRAFNKVYQCTPLEYREKMLS